MWISRVKSFFQKNKKPILLSLLLVCVGALAWMTIIFVHRLKEPVIPASQAIPNDVAWYIEFKDAQQCWEKIRSGNELADELRNFPYFASLFSNIGKIDSIILLNNAINDIIKGQGLTICCRYTPNAPEYLFLMNLPDAHQEELIHDFIKTSWDNQLTLQETEENGVILMHVKMNNGSEYALSVTSGIFMLSTSNDFLDAALKTLKAGNGLMTMPSFTRVKQTMGSKVDANVCLNLKQLGRRLGPYISENHQDVTTLLNSFGIWSGMDMIIRKDEVLLSGYMSAEKKNYLDIFRGEQGQKMTLPSHIPYNTAVMLYFGATNLQTIIERQQSYRTSTFGNPTPTIENLEQQHQCDLHDEFFSWMGSEMALVITESPSASFRSNAYMVFSANTRKAEKILTEISVAAEDLPATNADEEKLAIRQITIPELFPTLFGSAFSYVSGNYYIITDECVIFGNTPLSLKNYLSSRLSGKTLSTNENYKAFADNVSEQSSLCLYVNIRKSAELIKPVLSAELEKTLDVLTPQLRNFQAFAIQITPEKDLFYTNVYLKYNPSYKDENPAVWETAVDSTVIFPPIFVVNAADSHSYVVIVDQLNHLYLIDAMGRICWTYKASEPILGQVQVIEKSQSRETQLLFNTQHQLVLLDMQGKFAKNFPVVTRFPANSAVTAIDYDHKGDYRLFWVSDDHKLSNFSLSGKPTTGWVPPSIGAYVNKEISHVRLFEKDYIIVTDVNGICHFYDRKGRPAFNPPSTEFIRANNSTFFVFEDAKRSRIITTDRKGRIIRIAPDGNWESINLKEFSPEHTFRYDDFDGNEIKDYIYIDSNSVTVFDVNKHNIFELEFPAVLQPALIKVKLADNVVYFGTVSKDTKQLFLFNKEGWSAMNKFLIGSIAFSAGNLDQSGFVSLITADNNKVFDYYLTDSSVQPY